MVIKNATSNSSRDWHKMLKLQDRDEMLLILKK